MCYTCGCRLPFEDHGDRRNVIESAFAGAGRTKEIDWAGLVEAKRNMLSLLQAERRAGQLARPRRSYARKKS